MLGAFTIHSLALYFVIKSALESGITKGLKKAGKDIDTQNGKILQIEKLAESHWYNAPFVDGVMGNGQYCKTEKIVLLRIEFSFLSDDSTAIMVFPEGFRPVNKASVVGFSKTSPPATIGITIGSNGYISCNTPIKTNLVYTLETFFPVDN